MKLLGSIYYLNTLTVLGISAFYIFQIDKSFEFIIPALLGMILLVMTNNFLGENRSVMNLTMIVHIIFLIFVGAIAIPNVLSEYDDLACFLLSIMSITNILCLLMTIRHVRLLKRK